MLEIRHLRTLSALRSAGSLVRAAQLLNLTQSALSHQIKLLEDRYGGPLFERKSVPIGFTATGARLLKLADLLLPEIEAAEREVARLTQGDTGQLRVVLECHTCFDWLMPVMDEFRKRWPDVEIDLVSGFHSEPAELLRSESRQLQGDISDILVALQFQDRSSQILQQVGTDIQRLAAALGEDAPRSLEPGNWLRDMQASYTTPEQHALHQQGSTAADTPAITFF